MKTLFVMTMALIALTLSLPAVAEDAVEAGEAAPEGWQVVSDVNLTMTQNAYSDNWDGGETGALSWALNSNTLAESQVTDVLNSKNTFKLAFGQTHSQDKESKQWLRPSTTTDLIDLESVLRYTRGWFVDPFVSGRVESKFLDTSDKEKNRTFNPTTFTESFGVARVLIKEEHREWTTRLGGAIRQHIDRDALVPGENEGEFTRETLSTDDGGIEFVSELRTPLADGAITFTSDLSIYKALFFSESDAALNDDWKSPDVNWENTFSASITEHIVVNLFLQGLYDKQIDSNLRFKETLSLGFTLKLL